MKTVLSVFFFCGGILLAGGVEKDPFPQTAEIPAELKMPAGTRVTIAPDGTPMLHGKPRMLIGVKICSGSPEKDLQPRPGYPDFMKWFYEKPMSLESAHRLGFDFISVNTVTPEWVKRQKPDAKIRPWSGYEVLFKTGLPLHLDIGGYAPWELGWFLRGGRKYFPERTFNDYEDRHGNHWMPYSVFSPEGRRLYLDAWEFGVREALRHGANLMRVEILNEPSYNDPSEYNRKEFIRYLSAKYGTAEAMNRKWKSSYPSMEAASRFKNPAENPGLYVDWSKFLEEGITRLCHEGAERIQRIAPGIPVCLQSRGSSYFRYLPDTRFNLYEINRKMASVSTGTAGGVAFASGEEGASRVIDTPNSPWVGEGMLQIAFFRALADGKSIHDDETYFRKNDPHGFYQEFMRGVNQITVFEFSKRAWDWRTEAEGKAQAARRSWMILNPYAMPYAEFTKILLAKKNIFAVSDLFAPRNRNVNRPIALLFSYPTERFSGVTGNLSSAYAANTISALSFSHYQPDLILEEQLPSGRADRYRVLIAAGVKNTLPETPAHLEKWIRNGGIFLALLDTLSADEYGVRHALQLFPDFADKASGDVAQWNAARHPNLPGPLSGFQYKSLAKPSGWEKIGGNAWRKPLGKGWIYYIGTRFADYSLASVLGGILAGHGIHPACRIVNAEKPAELAPNIEIAAAERNGIHGLMMMNHDKYPKLILVRSESFSPGSEVLDSFNKRLLKVRKDKSVLLPLNAFETTALISGPSEALKKRMPGAKAVSEDALRKLYAAMPRPEKTSPVKSGYAVHAPAMKMIDLRRHVNREFRDSIAGDGKGGWTDQGAVNCLQEVPFGIRKFLNVPCDLIRWDMNGDKCCIVLDSTSLQPGFGLKKVEGIEIREKARAVYFFHASAWGADNGKAVMDYMVHYASGKQLRIPVRGGKEITDWFRIGNRRNVPKTTPVAWTNTAKHGFVCWRWENPNPEDEILSLSVESCSTNAVGIVLAITVEKDLYAGRMSIPWGMPVRALGFGAVDAVSKDHFIEVRVRPDARPFGGIRIGAKRKWLEDVPNAAKRNPVLVFDVRRGPGAMGQPDLAKTSLAIRVNGGKYLQKTFRPENGESFQTVEYSLKELMPDESKWGGLFEILLQYRGVPTYGMTLRNFRIMLDKE